MAKSTTGDDVRQHISASLANLTSKAINIRSILCKHSGDSLLKCKSVLSADERSHVGRFPSEHLRATAIASRATLRMFLGRYLGLHPSSIRFTYGLNGKPRLLADSSLQFSVSHSDDLLVMAFTIGCEVGIDVEHIGSHCNIDTIASLCFSSEEAADLLSLPITLRQHAFFRCWTRKEAYMKATGEGLSTSLDRFRVTLRPGEPAVLIRQGNDRVAANEWTLHDLDIGQHCAAALAYRDSPRLIQECEAIAISDVCEML
jgi:4'-phosphopantetheinyl transferase